MSTKRWHIDRRHLLRGLGVGIALPHLDVMETQAATANKKPCRLVCIGTHLGFHAPAFFPKATGASYKMPQLLKPMEPLRKQFTVFSGLDHPGVGKGHPRTVNYLTGVGDPKKRKQMSIDQVAANHTGPFTRFRSVNLQAKKAGTQKGQHLAFGPGGLPIPQSSNHQQVFDQLFKSTTRPKVARQSISDAKSVLDHVMEDARDLERVVSDADRNKLDEYMTSIREVEKELERASRFVDSPLTLQQKIEIPEDAKVNMNQGTRLMLKLIGLALQSDLTRVATLRIPGEKHSLSHHGRKAAKVRGLVQTQLGYTTEVALFLKALSEQKEPGGTMLDNTLVLLGSGMGNAATHSTANLPILLAGGGLKHGTHRRGSVPLSNLFVTMLRRMGVQTDRFSNSRGSVAI